MRLKWKAHQSNNPHVQHIIQPGLDKLEEYRGRTALVPAYVLAMCEFFCGLPLTYLRLINVVVSLLVINPTTKLRWYQKHMPEELNAAKAIFLREVSVTVVYAASC